MTLFRTGLFVLGLSALAACNTTAAPAPEEAGVVAEAGSAEFASKLQMGQKIAEMRCATCHSIGLGGESPHPDAKPFRELSENYPVRDLEEALGEGILVGHPDMPVFVMNPYEIDALLTYLESIQHPHPA